MHGFHVRLRFLTRGPESCCNSKLNHQNNYHRTNRQTNGPANKQIRKQTILYIRAVVCSTWFVYELGDFVLCFMLSTEYVFLVAALNRSIDISIWIVHLCIYTHSRLHFLGSPSPIDGIAPSFPKSAASCTSQVALQTAPSRTNPAGGGSSPMPLCRGLPPHERTAGGRSFVARPPPPHESTAGGTQYHTCTFRHFTHLEVVPHPTQVNVPSDT